MNAPETIFAYRARALNVVDGDTVDLFIDLGFRMTSTQRVRLLGVNTPELHSPDLSVRERAVAAKQFLMSMLLIGGDWPLIVQTAKSDSFGRWLADIWVAGTHVNNALLEKGHAVPFKR